MKKTDQLIIDKGEIIMYKADGSMNLEVMVAEETVWLTQAQMVELFQSTKQNISLHINNLYKEQELLREATVKDYLTVQTEGNRQIKRVLSYYNLDVIISVGYRVKSVRGTKFRQWANCVLKDYLLKGYSFNTRINALEDKFDRRIAQTDMKIEELNNKMDVYIRTSVPPTQGIFYNNQFFDAHTFVCDLIRSAKKRIILIDNYIDDTVLKRLDKRAAGVDATIYTGHISKTLAVDIATHNKEYAPIDVIEMKKSHDRFLIIDDDLYHFGASIKDLGKKIFAFDKFIESPDSLLARL